jgi:hypothetical protein
MVESVYVTGRTSRDGEAVGEAHAVLAEAASGSGPFTAECGKQVDVAEGTFPPEGADAPAPCPACARVTGLSV